MKGITYVSPRGGHFWSRATHGEHYPEEHYSAQTILEVSEESMTQAVGTLMRDQGHEIPTLNNSKTPTIRQYLYNQGLIVIEAPKKGRGPERIHFFSLTDENLEYLVGLTPLKNQEVKILSSSAI